MPALNFKAQFAEEVEEGRKRQTIRLRRKKPIRVGDRLFLFAGMRTKQCRRLRAGTEAYCQSTEPIEIRNGRVMVNGRGLTLFEIWRLAKADGFETPEAFFSFFRNQYGLPVEGDVIRW